MLIECLLAGEGSAPECASQRRALGGSVSIFGTMLKNYSMLFSLIVGLFLLGLGGLSTLTGATNMKMDMLPFWKGETLWYGLLFLGLFGVLAAVLAALKKAKILLVLFTLCGFGLVVYGYFFSPVYRFSGASEAKGVAYFALGMLGAFFGSLYQYEKRRG
jgi:hypothetical protein